VKHLRKARWLVWLVAPLLLWWVLRNVPLQSVWASLRQLQPGQILALAAVNIGIVALINARGWLILRSLGYRLPFVALAGYRLAAFGLSYFTPGPQVGGEPLQVYLLNRRQGVPTTAAMAAVTLDRLLEMFANFTFLAMGSLAVLASGLFGARLGIAALMPVAGLLVLPGGYLLALKAGRQPLSALIRRFSGRFTLSASFARLSQAIVAAEQQMMHWLRHKPQALLQAALLSVLIWVFMVAEYRLAQQFLGIQLPFVQSIATLTAARLAFLLPSPGGLGTLEASQALALQALGLDPALGISLSLLIRGRDLMVAGSGLLLGVVLPRWGSQPALPSQASD
jgi:hypothetical protein